MTRAKPSTFIFLLFALLIGTCSAFEIDDDEVFCQDDKCGLDLPLNDGTCIMRGDNLYVHYTGGMYGGVHILPNLCKRSNIFHGDGYLVAYPSTGGVVFLKDPPAIDLQYLGLPHTYDMARTPDEDDALATAMIQMGAQWWPDWDLYFKHSSRARNSYFYNHHFPSDVSIAIPSSGGVWVANYTHDHNSWNFSENQEQLPCEIWLPFKPYEWHVKMRYALTMDDKAEMLKDMGATFYETRDEVPGLARDIAGAKDLFETFRERLEKMANHTYASRYCSDWEKEPDENKETSEKFARWGGWSLFNEWRLF